MAAPNRPVDPREFAALNQAFYRAEPAEYLELRLWALASTISGEGELEVGFGGFKIGRSAPPTDAQLGRYAALESTVLLHHAAEAMLRLYLAHSNRNPCPWLELARLRSFSEFKRRIAELKTELATEGVMNDVSEVFTWTSTREAFVEMSDEAWSSHRSALRQLLTFSIDLLLEEAPFYNAAKHGLAVLAGPMGMSIGDANNPLISVDGDALSILEQSEDHDGVRRWKRTTRWIHPSQSMAISGVIVRAMESLWEAARGHYGQPNDPRKIWVAEADKIEKLLALHVKTGFNVTTFSEGVIHDEPNPGPEAFSQPPSRGQGHQPV